MSTVDRPVTQIVDTAVNTASAIGGDLPDVVAMGSDSSAVKTRISDENTSTAKRAGDEVVRLRNRSKARPTPDRVTYGLVDTPSNIFDRRRVPVPRLPSDMRVLSAVASLRNHHGTPGGARLI